MSNHSYTHLAEEERYHISALYKTGVEKSEIARQIGRHKSTISREIKRNAGLRGYRPKQAHRFALDRKQNGNHQIKDFGFAYTHHLIEQDWSPEQIHGRLMFIGWDDVPCVERIYQYIYQDKADGGVFWYPMVVEGLSRFNPEAYARYKSLVPDDQQHQILKSYYQMMTCGDDAIRNRAAAEMMLWEEAGFTMQEYQPTEDLDNWHQGLLEAHYCAHNCFIEDQPIADKLSILQGMPVYIVNGRYDMLTPPAKAYVLHLALADSKLTVLDRAGHASKEPAMADALVSATDEMLLKLP